MTICIAALANENEKGYIVFATDHMVTTGLGQFEHSIVKYKQINACTIAMLSGAALLFEELIDLNNYDASLDKIKNGIFRNFKKKKEKMIENKIFAKFGIDKKFFMDALKTEIPNPFIHDLLKSVHEYSLKTSIMLIGFDGEGTAQISEINERGIYDFNEINFHAIGSGSDQAINTLLFQRHSECEKLSTAVYNVYKAKRNAEVKIGVGKETELLILSNNESKPLIPLSEDKINILSEIYENELEYGKTCSERNGLCP